MRTHSEPSTCLEPRPPLTARAAGRLWLVWAAVAATLTLGPLFWHLEYFQKTGPGFGLGIAAVLVGLSALAWLYWRFCPASLRGREMRWFAGAAIAATFLQEPWATTVVAGFAAGCYALGAAALARLGVELQTAPERLALRTGTGLGIWIVAMIPVGLAGLYGTWTFASLLAACLVAFRGRLPELWSDIRALDAAWRTVALDRSPLAAVLVAFLPAFAAAFWMAAMAPATAADPIAYHLPAARHYLNSGRLSPLPILPGALEGSRRLFSIGHSAAYSYYPQSFEELIALAWGLGGQPAAQLVSPLFTVLAALMAIALGRRCGLSRLAAAVGAGAAFSIPVVSWSGAIAKNDCMLAFFELAALFAVIASRDGAPRRRLLLAAFFLGLCFGTKHVAIFGAIPIAALMLNRLRSQAAPIKLAFALAAVFTVTGLSWHVRTWLATGNPLFPAGVRYAARPLPAIGGSTAAPWRNRLIYPWIAHFDGRMTNEGPSDNPLGFYFLFFAAGWLVLHRRPRSLAERECLVFCGLFAVYWIYSWGVLRYGAPLLIVLTSLTAGRVEALALSSGRWVRRGAASALAYCFAFALLPTLMLEVNVHQLRYFSRSIDRDRYLRSVLPGYPAVEALNARMGADDSALAVSNCALVYSRDPLRFRCVQLMGAMNPDKAERVERVIEASAPDFLVLPKDEKGESLLASAGAFGFVELVYEDSSYRVFERSHQ